MRLLVVLFVILSLVWSPAARAQTPPWTVTEVAGDVRLQNGDGMRPARRGAVLPAGEAIVTGAGGRAVLTRGQEFVVVSPGSRLRLPGAATGGGIVQILQDLGTAVYRIQKKMTPHFGVQTPFLAAVVKGTTFKVVADPQGATVQVLEGRVEVATSDGLQRQMVVPGVLAAVSAGNLGKLDLREDKVTARNTEAAPAKGGESRAKNDDKQADARSSEDASAEGRGNGSARDGRREDDGRGRTNSGRSEEKRFAGADAHRGNPDRVGNGGPRPEAGAERGGATVSRTPGEKAVLVRLPEAARNAAPPKGNEPEPAKPDTPKPDTPKPDKPEPVTPAKPESPKPDKPEPVTPEKPETPKPGRPEPAKPEPVTPTKPDTPRPDKPMDEPVPPPSPTPSPGKDRADGKPDDVPPPPGGKPSGTDRPEPLGPVPAMEPVPVPALPAPLPPAPSGPLPPPPPPIGFDGSMLPPVGPVSVE